MPKSTPSSSCKNKNHDLDDDFMFMIKPPQEKWRNEDKVRSSSSSFTATRMIHPPDENLSPYSPQKSKSSSSSKSIHALSTGTSSSQKRVTPEKLQKIYREAETGVLRQEIQKTKREHEIRFSVFREMTSYKKWPLQELAFQDLDSWMCRHLGIQEKERMPTSIPTSSSDLSPTLLALDSTGNFDSGTTYEEESRASSNHSNTSSSSSSAMYPTNVDTKRQKETMCTLSNMNHEIHSSPHKKNHKKKSSTPTFSRVSSQKSQWKEKYRDEFTKEQNVGIGQKVHFQDEKFFFLSPMWCMEPRIFAMEKSGSGKRCYVVAHLGRFFDHYWRHCDVSCRHYYEVIREGTPCRLYFDLEYSKEYNPDISNHLGNKLLEELIVELCSEVQQRYNMILTRESIVDLDSSTEKKFSRHLIVHFPNGYLFSDSLSCGRFVKCFIGRLAEEVATGVLAKRCPILSKYLFVHTKASASDDAVASTNRKEDIDQTYAESVKEDIPSCKKSNELSTMNMYKGKRTCFVDLGVYTRNRLFRILGSSKYGKSVDSALRIADENKFPFPPKFSNDKFYAPRIESKAQSLVTESIVPTAAQEKYFTPVLHNVDAFNWEDHGVALASTLVVPVNYSKLILPFLNDIAEDDVYDFSRPKSATASLISRASKAGPLKSCTGSSPFPSVDSFVQCTLANRGGFSGSIRAWSIIPGTDGDLSRGIISYHMRDNRWCECISRPHKSNNIIWNVSLQEMKYWQTCHDPECRMAAFRGNIRELPRDLQIELKDSLLEKALEVDVEFEKALMTLNICDDDIDSSNKRISRDKLINATACDEDVPVQNDSFSIDPSFLEALSSAVASNPRLFP